MDVPAGYSLLGLEVDGLGNPLDGKGPIKGVERRVADVKAPGIIPRKSVHEPMATGLKSVDAMIPIGRGQRELIGDRQTGKTAVALDTILNQKSYNDAAGDDESKNYIASMLQGSKRSTVAQLVKKLKKVAQLNIQSWSLQPHRIQPYAVFSILFCHIYGGIFRDNGRHALIIYDDLSKQAVAYRQMSLLQTATGTRGLSWNVSYLHSRL